MWLSSFKYFIDPAVFKSFTLLLNWTVIFQKRISPSSWVPYRHGASQLEYFSSCWCTQKTWLYSNKNKKTKQNKTKKTQSHVWRSSSCWKWDLWWKGFFSTNTHIHTHIQKQKQTNKQPIWMACLCIPHYHIYGSKATTFSIICFDLSKFKSKVRNNLFGVWNY